jgi:hypothetical protein
MTPSPLSPESPSQPVSGIQPQPPVESEPERSVTPFRFFAATSFWNAPVAADAALDPSSSSVVAALGREVAEEEAGHEGPAINTTAWSVPVYTVPASQPLVRVRLENESAPLLQKAWEAVPLPADAEPASGSDSVLALWQPSTDKLWEFWQLSGGTAGWQASWGGAMQSVSSDSGVYEAGVWPGAKPWWGSSGSSLSLVGGLISIEDLERGEINHALSMAIPRVRADVYAAPAQRTDGRSSSPVALPEGAHLRLDPALNLAALHLPRLTLMMAEAAQRYGIIVRDTGGNVAFYAQDPIPTGTEPYAGPSGYFEGKWPGQLLASFPWAHLQLLKMELHHLRGNERRKSS